MKNLKNRTISAKQIFICFILMIFAGSCSKATESTFMADFSYEFLDDNHVKFTNNSEGDYYSVLYDFGNGKNSSTLDKNEQFEMYYPEAGNYNVTLTIFNNSGKSSVVTKTVSIMHDDLVVSFTLEAEPANPYKFHLKNTTTGEFDSSAWTYRGKTVENIAQTVAYFPFAGQHIIQLTVTKGADSFSKFQTISIPSDDPNYVENLVLSWSDEFNGTEVNSENWTFETGAGGWGNNELQRYTNGDNVELNDGKLVITAVKVSDDKVAGSYTSSRMITLNKKEFTYGRMEIRAKLPSGTGIWPAIWMLGSNIKTVSWPACGEIDIMEYVGYEPNTVHATIHSPSSYGNSVNGKTIPLASCEEEFHNYGIIWSEKYIRFYIDEVINITYTYSPVIKNDETWPFNKLAFLILNVAVGGNWGGAHGIDNSIFPQKMEVDYVRVYQEKQQN